MTNHISSSTSKHRVRSFDFLRGIAILGVISVHTNQNFPTNIGSFDFLMSQGRFGVQLFYFISALTMCYMWEQRKGEQRPITNFYIRRFLRIAPLFWLAIPIYLYTNGLDSTYWAPEGIGVRQVLLTATFLHGFWPDSINSVVPGGWSIALEMTFYVIFPYLIIVFHNNKTYYLSTAFAVWLFSTFIFQDFLINFFSDHYQTNSTTIVKDFLYLNFINQAPVFLLGCFAYFAFQTKIKRSDVVIFFTWLGTAIFAKYYFEKSGLGFLCIYIFIGLFVYFSVKKNIMLKPFEMLGRNSYSIYLAHFLVLSILADILPYNKGVIAFFIGISLTTLISYALSLLLYSLIEKKVHRLASSITRAK